MRGLAGPAGRGPAEDEDARALLALYTAQPVGETRAIEVSCTTTDPERAARIANAVAEAYIEETVERRRRLLRETVAAYTLQSPEQREKLDRAERELIRFQVEHLIVSSDKPEETLRQEELDLVEQLAAARRERISAQARLMANQTAGLQAYSAEAAPAAKAGRAGIEERTVEVRGLELVHDLAADDARIRQLLDSRLTQRALITDLGRSFAADHAKIRSAKTTLDEIERELADAARRYYERMRLARQAAEWKEKEIARLLTQHRAKIVRLRTQLAQLEDLRQRRDSLRDLLGPVARSQAKLGLLASLDLPGASLEERAVPPTSPSEPNAVRYLLIALVGGLLAGGGLAFLLESLDESVRTPDDVERAAPVKMLGSVSTIKKRLARGERGRALVTADRSESVVAEQFRSLRTSILELSELSRQPGDRHGNTGTVVLVTSPDLAEGKTTVSFNLAEAFAQLVPPEQPPGTVRSAQRNLTFVRGESNGDGRRESHASPSDPASARPVIIVDADLRRPKGHELLGVPRSPGLVEALEGEVRLEDAVRRSPVPNLFFLPAGRKTPRPAELVASDRLGEIVAELRRTYSSVWLDAAPVIPVTDARILAPAADLILLVVRSSRTRRRALARTYELLVGASVCHPVGGASRGNGQTMGAVLNGVAPAVERQYGYYGQAYDRYYSGKEA